MRSQLLLFALLAVACEDEKATDTATVAPEDNADTGDLDPFEEDSGDPEDTEDPEDTGDDSGDTEDPEDTGVDTGTPDEDPVEEPDVAEFGFDETRELVVLATEASGLDTPRDIAFHPERDELWVLNRYGLSGPVDGGSITIISGVEAGSISIETRADTFGYHFMDEAAGLAFGDAVYSGSSEINFATCGESRNDYGGTSSPDDFMGPALWSSDLEIFAMVNQMPFGMLGGSHLDMLHQSPNCMGIAHEEDNAYWAFDGKNGTIVRYDFVADHGPGYDDHSDGIVHRYTEATVTRVPNVSSNLVLDKDTGWLYIADTGGSRVQRLDIHSGSDAGTLRPYGEDLAEYIKIEGATVETFIGTGLTEPSGLALQDDRLFVSDHATGTIIAYDLEGTELGRMETGASGLMGIDIGPDGLLYYVDLDAASAVQVIPGG